MKFRNFILLAACIVVVSCASSGRINQTEYKSGSSKAEKSVLSEYYEDIQYVANGKVKAHLLITLGNERLPKDYVLQNKWGKISRSQGDIEEVYEIYFSNEGKEAVSIELNTLNGMDLKPKSMLIEPTKFIKTEPLVRITSVYKPSQQYNLNMIYMGKPEIIESEAKRLTLDELKKRAK